MNCYHYHPVTGEFMGVGEADPDPRTLDAWLVPAHATLKAPPPVSANQAVICSGGAWLIVADHRGTDYWLSDGSQHQITMLGESVPAGALLAPPPPPFSDIVGSARRTINVRCDQQLAELTVEYPSSEISSWSKQEAEARAYTANPTAPTPLLLALATARGLTIADLAVRVIAKADAFAATAGAIIGQRQAQEDQITAIINDLEMGEDEKRIALEAYI